MKKEVLKFLILLMVAFGAGPASSYFYQWSVVANNNATADPAIGWAEGQSPSSVNDSARAMMSVLAIRGIEQGGALVTAGTTSAITLSTLTGYPNLAALSGQMISFIHGPGANDAGATLNIDGIGPLPLMFGVSAIPAGTIQSGGIYTVSCRAATSQCLLVNSFASTFNIPLGGILLSTLAAPNANFLEAGGQCISTTTYAAYWVARGSPAPGSCSAGNFQLLDARGYALAGLDTLNGVAAGRLTTSGTGCGTSMTTVGAVCANGIEGSVIPLGQLPTGITSNNASQAINVALPSGAARLAYSSNGDLLTFSAPSTGAFVSEYSAANNWLLANGMSGTNSISVTSNNTSGTARPNIQPTTGLKVFVRVI